MTDEELLDRYQVGDINLAKKLYQDDVFRANLIRTIKENGWYHTGYGKWYNPKHDPYILYIRGNGFGRLQVFFEDSETKEVIDVPIHDDTQKTKEVLLPFLI